jgi:glycosyltransferase involved in cell wall biosynthesis
MTQGAERTTGLRVLVDATALPADRRGVGRYVDELVAALARLGASVAVAAQPRDVGRYAATIGPGRIHAAPRWARHPAARLAWEQTGLPILLRRLRPDVLLSPHYTMPLANAGPGRTPQVVTCHDATFFSHPEVHTAVKARFFPAWTRISASRADAVVVPSRATLDEIVAHTGADPGCFTVVPLAADHVRFRPPPAREVAAARAWAGVPERTAYLAFLGTLEPRKNIPALVDAFVQVCRARPDPPVLVLAGGRGWDGALDGAIARVPPELRVLRPGFVPDDLAAGLLGGAEVFAYPSLGEGFGLPVLEAMACAVPVLTTRMLALPEVGGDAVEYAATPATSDVAAALQRLLDDPARRTRLAALGRERALGFTWENAARAYLEVFQRVVERPRGRRRPR